MGAQLICRALAKMYSNKPVSNLPEGFRAIARYKVFGTVPMIIVKGMQFTKIGDMFKDVFCKG